MKKYICDICGFVYDEAAGIPEKGIAPGTAFEDLPEDWTCPLCGATKDEFSGKNAGAAAEKPVNTALIHDSAEPLRELSFGELSALCSNLAKGCEKQHRTEEEQLFYMLADYYDKKCPVKDDGSFSALAALIEKDLGGCYAEASAVSQDKSDRGALRALTWSEKVTKILSSLIGRYEKQGAAFTENTDVYVCEICGFIYIGDNPPEICPVCKVPGFKLNKV